jgi:hypothetical protein
MYFGKELTCRNAVVTPYMTVPLHRISEENAVSISETSVSMY